MSVFRQVGAVTAMNIANIPARMGSSLVVVIGMTCVVAVFVSMLSLSAGFMRAVHSTARDDRAMVLSQGQGDVFEGGSSLTRDAVTTIMDAPGIAKTTDGKPDASAEVLGFLPVVKKSNGLFAFSTLRGIGPEAFPLRPEMKLVEGRMFKPAVHEVIVGKLAQDQFKGLNVGDHVALPEGEWTVVGAFESNGDLHESELLADAETVLSAYRKTTFNSATVQLANAQAFDRFKDSLTTNPTLTVQVERESSYYERLSKQLNQLLTIVAYWVGGIMAVGAVFGALNTMYSAVSARSVEIATLRAIGFGSSPVVVSVLIEALLLALIGAVLGAALAWIAFSGNQHGIGGMVIKLSVTRGLLVSGIVVAAIVGFVGGLFPAVRAARLPVATALQVR